MAQNTPLEVINFHPLAGRGVFNQAVSAVNVETLEADYGVDLDIKVEVVEIQILDGTVVFTTDGTDPTAAGAGFRWRVAAPEAWAWLSRAEALRLKVIALAGNTPKLNISPKALAQKQ